MMVKLLLYCWFCSCETYGKINTCLVESELGLLDNKISSMVRSWPMALVDCMTFRHIIYCNIVFPWAYNKIVDVLMYLAFQKQKQTRKGLLKLVVLLRCWCFLEALRMRPFEEWQPGQLQILQWMVMAQWVFFFYSDSLRFVI